MVLTSALVSFWGLLWGRLIFKWLHKIFSHVLDLVAGVSALNSISGGTCLIKMDTETLLFFFSKCWGNGVPVPLAGLAKMHQKKREKTTEITRQTCKIKNVYFLIRRCRLFPWSFKFCTDILISAAMNFIKIISFPFLAVCITQTLYMILIKRCLSIRNQITLQAE